MIVSLCQPVPVPVTVRKEKDQGKSLTGTYWNPPWSEDVKIHIGKEFLTIIRTSFPPNHKLYKVCNRNTIKLSMVFKHGEMPRNKLFGKNNVLKLFVGENCI